MWTCLKRNKNVKPRNSLSRIIEITVKTIATLLCHQRTFIVETGSYRIALLHAFLLVDTHLLRRWFSVIYTVNGNDLDGEISMMERFAPKHCRHFYSRVQL